MMCFCKLVWARKETLVVMNDMGRGHKSGGCHCAMLKV